MSRGVDTKKLFFFLIFFLLTNIIFSQRVVSMAPAITEIVFALGKGDTLVGVTKFCDYPPLAKKIAKVGGFLDVNMEALLALAPEIVISYPEQYANVKFLESKTHVLVVKHQSLSDLFNSIVAIGNVLHAEMKAKSIIVAMQKNFANVAKGVNSRKKVRILIIAGRNADELKNMYIIGKNDFLNDILEIAGGVNAYQGDINYPNISMETVIFLNPEIILEISAYYEGISDEEVFKLWSPFKMLLAVQHKQIKVIKESFWLRPGPRVGLIAEELAGFISSAINLQKSINDD
jgi:iron complex transport system substrate-binding protein